MLTDTRIEFTHWLITGIPKGIKEEKAISPLFPQRYEAKAPDRRILHYPEIRDNRDQFIEVTLYGITNHEDANGPQFIEMTEPELIVKNQTLYLPYEGEELILHPLHQINGHTEFLERWYLKFHGRIYNIYIDDVFANTVAVGKDGDRNSLFEKTVGEYDCYTNGHVELASSKWAYSLDLDFFIRVSKDRHVAVCGDKAFILDKPLVSDRYRITSETTHTGKTKIHVQSND